MLWQLHQVVLGVHILVAIIWVGGVLFIGWGLFPSVSKWTFHEQRKIFSTVMDWVHWPLTFAGIFVIATGILLGTVLGPIHHLSDFVGTRYGIHWLFALVTGLLTLAWGVFIGNKMAIHVFSQEELWEQADIGKKKSLYKKLAQVVAAESIEILGFFILIYLMISF